MNYYKLLYLILISINTQYIFASYIYVEANTSNIYAEANTSNRLEVYVKSYNKPEKSYKIILYNKGKLNFKCKEGISVKSGDGELILFRDKKIVTRLTKDSLPYMFSQDKCETLWEKSKNIFLSFISTNTYINQGIGEKSVQNTEVIEQDIYLPKGIKHNLENAILALCSEAGNWETIKYRMDIYKGEKKIGSITIGEDFYDEERNLFCFTPQIKQLIQGDHYTISGNVGSEYADERVVQKGKIIQNIISK